MFKECDRYPTIRMVWVSGEGMGTEKFTAAILVGEDEWYFYTTDTLNVECKPISTPDITPKSWVLKYEVS